jgi:hypothetical protein
VCPVSHRIIASLSHFRQFSNESVTAVDDDDHDLLIHIKTQNETIIERLGKSDERMLQYESDARTKDARIHSLELDRNAVKAIIGFMTVVGGSIVAIMTWVSLTFPNWWPWHAAK